MLARVRLEKAVAPVGLSPHPIALFGSRRLTTINSVLLEPRCDLGYLIRPITPWWP
jgi:hypothetical protein